MMSSSTREARDLTDRIKTAVNDLAELLWSAHEGKAWKSLGYSSWQTYCNVEFRLSKQRAFQLMHFVEIRQTITAKSQPGLTPQNEKQTRPLARIEPEQQPVVWEAAVELANGQQPTSRQVELSVANFTQLLPVVSIQPSWTASQLKRKAKVAKGRTVLANEAEDNALIAWAERENKLVRIDQLSDWKNPFIVDEDGCRDEVFQWFKEYFSHKRSLHKRLHELGGKVLVCWRYPAKCHGHHYLDLLAKQ
jgi:hypothetical protein